jgi:hypothetical protein
MPEGTFEEVAMARLLKNIGEGTYVGFDRALAAIVRCPRGGIIAVSEDKAKQLLADFPEQWQEVADDAPPASEDDASMEEDAQSLGASSDGPPGKRRGGRRKKE